MTRRVGCIALIAVLILVGALSALLWERTHREQLDPHFRPRFAKAEFKDLVGDPLEEVVTSLVTLGVLDFNEGYFQPDAHLERGTFVRWLVRAWNIFHRDQPKLWIRLASVSPNSTWTYGDVMPHTPLYPYLEGMIQAGIPVGFEQGEWSYGRDLNRQEMVFLRNAVAMGRDAVWAPEEEREDYRVQLRSILSDADEVAEEYLCAIHNDVTRGETIRIAFTDVDLTKRNPKPALDPSRLVTRREVIRAISQFGKRNYKNVRALGKWEPLTEAEAKALDEADHAAREAARGRHEH